MTKFIPLNKTLLFFLDSIIMLKSYSVTWEDFIVTIKKKSLSKLLKIIYFYLIGPEDYNGY